MSTWEAASVTTQPSIDLIRCPQLATRASYAYAAVTHDVSRFVFTAGACPLDAAGNTVAVGDVVGQAEQVMANLLIALRAADAELTDVIKTTVTSSPLGRSSAATSAITTPRARSWESPFSATAISWSKSKR
jgi:enamine deaminase RidA (YjgF/YER057c/UK114 family)